jgi:hypothetical protein
MRRNEVAAEIHRRMCEDERFGYSWEERYGAYEEVWNIGGRDYVIRVGDYECGTSVKTAWALALQGTPWEGSLDGYVYSQNALETFLGSGLFYWKDVSEANLGDIYLNIVNHLAMDQGNGELSEFSWGDNGAYGNQRGDQSGWESHVCPWYSYPWDGALCYNGLADERPEQRPGEPFNDMGLRYRAHVEDLGWCDFVRDGQIAGTYNFGKRMEALVIEPCDGLAIDVKLHVQDKGWQSYGTARKDRALSVGTTGQALRLEAIQLDDVENTTGKRLEYRVHQANIGWKAWTPAGYPTGSTGQGSRLEAIQIRLV